MAKGEAPIVKGGSTGYFSGVGDRLSSFGSSSTAAGRANLYGSAGAGLSTTAAMLIGGAVSKGFCEGRAKVSLGTYVGQQ